MLRCRLVAPIAGLLLVPACRAPAPTATDAGVEPPPRPSAPADTEPPAREDATAPSHTVRGPIDASFVAARDVIRVGEPLVVRMQVRPTAGALKVFVGGDMRNQGTFPMHVGVRVERTSDHETVCDNVTAPPFPGFGGKGYDRTVEEGETLRQAFVLNPICPALSEPGEYRVTLHRRLLSTDAVAPGDDVPLSCDIYPLHADSTLDGYPPECQRQVADAPSVTSTFRLTVEPYDADAMKVAIPEAYAQARPDDEMGSVTSHIDRWLCGWITCGCARDDDARKMPLPASRPAHLPAPCPGPPRR